MCGDGLIMPLHLTERREMLQLCDEGFHTVTIGNRSQVDFTLLAIHWVNICSHFTEQTWKNVCVNIQWPSIDTHTHRNQKLQSSGLWGCVWADSQSWSCYTGCVSAQRINDIYWRRQKNSYLSVVPSIYHSVWLSFILSTLVDHVINRGFTMEEAGRRVQPNVNRSTVSSIVQTFRRENG